MSSLSVRDQFKNFIESENPGLSVFDMSEFFDKNTFPENDFFLAIQYIASDEENSQFPECYRETGRINVHYCKKDKRVERSTMLTAVELIRKQFRGKRISESLLVQNVGTPKIGTSEAIKLNGPFTGITFYVDYLYDFNKGD